MFTIILANLSQNKTYSVVLITIYARCSAYVSKKSRFNNYLCICYHNLYMPKEVIKNSKRMVWMDVARGFAIFFGGTLSLSIYFFVGRYSRIERSICYKRHIYAISHSSIGIYIWLLTGAFYQERSTKVFRRETSSSFLAVLDMGNY